VDRHAVTWRGQSAVYTKVEREIMSALPLKEQAFVHLLKSFTDGEIQDRAGGSATSRILEPGSPTELPQPLERVGPVYTDPEDIPFGKPKRVKKTYAVAWSWRKHKIHKTKKRCEERLRVWKAWKERQGWTVMKFASGYLAFLGEKREVIQLHEYDRETKERL